MSNKSVVIVGVLDKRGSTNISMAKAFIRFKYNVIPINYRTIIQQHRMKSFENLVIDTVKKNKPYLVIFCKCNGINSNLIEECNKYSKTWLWNMDPISTIERCPEVLQHAKNATFSSCTGLGIAKWFSKNIEKECYHIEDGLDYDIFKPVEPIELQKADISFIGSKTSLRHKYIELLFKTGYNVRAYGNGYTEEIVNNEFSQVCSSSKFMLSINTQTDIEGYYSNRLLRYMGCGSCVLHYDPTESLKHKFIDRKHLILFKDEKELLEKLSKITNIERIRIALAGRDLVLNSLTWEHSVKKILDICDKK